MIIIDIWISYGAPDWYVLRIVLLSLCIDDIFIDIWISYGAPGDVIGSVFTTNGALFVIISTVK
jgi:hypothetical protein